jgi:hypothetical protein
MGRKTTRSSTAVAARTSKEKPKLKSSVKTQAKKKTGRRGTHKKLEAAKRKVRGRGRPPGAKKSNPKAAIKKSSREKSAAGSGSGMENPIQSIVFLYSDSHLKLFS